MNEPKPLTEQELKEFHAMMGAPNHPDIERAIDAAAKNLANHIDRNALKYARRPSYRALPSDLDE